MAEKAYLEFHIHLAGKDTIVLYEDDGSPEFLPTVQAITEAFRLLKESRGNDSGQFGYLISELIKNGKAQVKIT